jgi:hypothetical protein
MALFGHSGSHAPQLMHSSVMKVAMGLSSASAAGVFEDARCYRPRADSA